MLMNPQPQRRSRAVVWLGTGLALSTFTVAYATKIASHFSDDTIRPGIAVVDPDVQKITDAAVRATVKKFDAQAAFAVVADPTTGRVLAVSNVDKRPNPLKGQWALSFRIEPASVIKTLLVTAAFDAKLSTPDETLNCENGSYTLGGKLYQDWKEFEKLTTTETVVSSSNVCGIKIAEKLGGVRLLETLKSYGFGSEGTASDFPAARPGQLPDPAQFSPADLLATLATGNSGVWITPLEMISAYSAIANGGYVLKPQEATAAAHSRKVVRRAFSEETAAAARKILVQVIEKGTGANAKSTHYRFAGKTATTWHPGFGDPAKLGGVANVAGFIGLAPAESARLVIYVSVFEPKPSAHGATQAAPLFKEIAEKVLAHWKFEADPK